MFDVVIVGGGASGLVTAISISNNNSNASIAIIEKNEILGKKIYATGNGRCNLTNSNCEGAKETVAFFNSIGILTMEEEEGRIYPNSENAKDVVEALENQIKFRNIKVFKGSFVEKIEKMDESFHVFSTDTKARKKEITRGKCLVIAMGGKAAPAHGTVGDGYRLARNLGHQITPIVPALTPIECEGDFAELKGLRLNCKLSILDDKLMFFSEKGQVQFIKDGISGIVAFNGSHHIKKDMSKLIVHIDPLPNLSYEEVVKLLEERKNIKFFRVENLLLSIVDNKLGRLILKNSELIAEDLATTLKIEDLKNLAKLIKNVEFPIKGLKGWKEAQVTRGGIDIKEVDLSTMESKIVSNLYFVGEILDLQGYCGGYNLQIAWETGLRVGKNFGK